MSAEPRGYAKKNDSETPPRRSKRAWGKAKGAEAMGCRFRGSLRRHGVVGDRFFFASLPLSFARPLPRNAHALRVKMILPDSWAATDPRGSRRGFV